MSSVAMMKEHIDLTTISDSDSDVVITRTPRQHGQPPSRPQSQSQPAGSRHHKPISPPALNRQPVESLQNDASSITAAPISRGLKEFVMNQEIARTAAARNSSISVKPLFKPTHNPHHSPHHNSLHNPLHNPQSSTPPSAKKQVDGHKTPKTQTPRKADWTVEILEERLRKFAQDIGTDTAKLTASLIQSSWKRKSPQRRFISKKDCFAGIRLMPFEGTGKSSDTMRIKTKQVGQGRSGKQEKRENYPVICIKTKQEPVPRYAFHHVEITKNILSPNTMLTYVPHLRDLADNEEVKYRRWLENLETMDKTSGFATLSRHQKVVKTIQKERATVLLLYLDRWLNQLAIDNCTKSTLIRHMANHTDTVTPQQKSSILNSYNDDAGSPRSARAVRMFTEAFDRVFNSPSLGDHAVPLREVLLLDGPVDSIVDSKKWMKETPSQAKVTDEHMTVETFLETYAALGCLICTGSSCEHGDYGYDNERKRFSIEVIGGLSPMLRQKNMRRAGEHDDGGPILRKPQNPCGEDCFLNGRPGTRARGWSETETMILKSHLMTLSNTNIPVQCTAALTTGRPCWDVNRQLDKIEFSPTINPISSPTSKVKSLHWYDRWKKMLLNDWQEQTNTHEHQRKDHFDPCSHDGPCTPKNCSCVQNKLMCERFCRCTAECCAYKFTGCACHSQGKTCVSKQKDRPCICIQLNRECDPVLCGSCGALERANPLYADSDALHATGCQNCAMQRGKSKSVVLGKSKVAGYGLYTTEDIAQDDFVIEYVGELISHDEGVRREARRGDVFDESSNTSYLFTLLEQEGTWVDAAIYGNLSRYINHQDANCNVTPRILYVNGEYRIKFSSLRDIKAGEELFFNYGENFPNLTKKLLEEGEVKEKAKRGRKKIIKDPPDELEPGQERVRKKPGRKPGRPGRKPGRKPGRPKGSKTKPKVPVQVEPEPEVEATVEDFEEDLFHEAEASTSRKRKRGHAVQDSEEEEYRPDMGESQDEIISINAEAPGSRGKPRGRKRLGPGKARKTAWPSQPSKPNDREVDSGAEVVAPKRRGRKARKVEQHPQPEQEVIHGEMVVDNRTGHSGASNNILRHTAAIFAPDSDHDVHAKIHEKAKDDNDGDDRKSTVEVTPSRGNNRRQPREILESSPLSTPMSEPEYLISEYDTQSTSHNDRTNVDMGNEEYTGESWVDSHGARHHGHESDDDDDDDEVITPRRRHRRKPARYID